MRKRGVAFWFLNLCAVWTAINGVVADWNHSHLFNPEFTAHAKYHDAVSISAGILLGLVALFYLWRRSCEDLTFALVAMSVFWAALLMGFAFPGTAEIAAEHPESATLSVEGRRLRLPGQSRINFSRPRRRL